MRTILSKYFHHFAYYYRSVRYRVILIVLSSIALGLLDGLGLAMFIPLLQNLNASESSASEESMPGFEFLVDGIKYIGFEMNLTTILLFILFFFTLKNVFKFFGKYYEILTKRVYVQNLKLKAISLLTNFSYRAYLNEDQGRLNNTLSLEMTRMTQAFTQYFLSMQSGVLVAAYISMALYSSFKFAFLIIIGAGLTSFFYNYLNKKTKQLSKKITVENSDFQGLLLQYASNFKYLKATGYIYRYGQKLREMIFTMEDTQRKTGYYSSLLVSIREPISIGLVVFAIFVQVNYLNGDLTTIILSLLFFFRSLTYLLSFQEKWNRFLYFSGSINNMEEFFIQLNTGQEVAGTLQFERLKAGIELKKVSYQYGENRVLNNIDLNINRGDSIALIGASGSGKSTLVNILTGLLEVENGTFLLSAEEFSKYDKTSYQQRIGYVTQEPVIFDDTLFNNITFWDEINEDNEKRFNEVIDMSLLRAFLNDLPEGLNTKLGSSGSMISGGQKQRISIARELYKSPEILIFDEATSALDSETEQELQQNIELLKGKYTMITIAHRLSTVRDVDRIYILESGSIVNVGTYEELSKKSQLFRRLANIQ
ncbi:ABC transporter ATP-binding protein [Roseivirga echinicomitans]